MEKGVSNGDQGEGRTACSQKNQPQKIDRSHEFRRTPSTNIVLERR